MRALKDGESKLIRVASYGNKNVSVTAHRQDCDTPCVLLVANGCSALMLTDVQAEELIIRLRRALSILPSSK